MSVIRSARQNRVSRKVSRRHAISALSAATSFVALAGISRADTYSNIWATDGHQTALNSPTAWQDDTSPATTTPPPAATDTAQFDALTGLTSPTTFTLGANTSWLNLNVLSPGADVTIGSVADSTNTLTLGGSGINVVGNNLSILDPIALAAQQPWNVDPGLNLLVSGVISGANNLTAGGPGTVTLTAQNQYTGATAVNAGTMDLDFTAAGAPASNIVNATSTLNMGGGTLLMNNGATSNTVSQTFAATNLTLGNSTFTVASAGTGSATLNLGAITANNGNTAVFNLPATGQIQTSTGTASTILASGPGTAATVFTVGLNDWAAKDATNTQIVAGSSVTGFYTVFTGTGTTLTIANSTNADLQGSGIFRAATGSSSSTYGTLRFNTPNTDTLQIKASGTLSVNGIMVTNAVGANNILIQSDATATGNPAAVNLGVNSSAAGAEITFWQNDVQGLLLLNTAIRNRSTSRVIFAGPGTTVVTGINPNTGSDYINGGAIEINADSALGDPTTAAVTNLAGGVVVNASVALDNGSSATGRPFLVTSQGGYLSATTNNIATIDGILSGSGRLSFGSSILPGTGPGTANATGGVNGDGSVVGNGTIIVNGIANTYSGASTVSRGLLRLDNASGSALGTGNLTVASGATLGGTGGLTGSVTVASGGVLTPGDPSTTGPVVGTLSVGTLNLNTGSLLNFGFSGTTAGLIKVGGNLTFGTGVGLNADNAGHTTAFTNDGTFNIFDVAPGDSISGLANLSVLNNPNPGTISYNFGTTPDGSGGTFVTMTINGGSVVSVWNVNGGGSWAASGSWNPHTVPNDPSNYLATAELLGAVTSGTANVTLDNDKFIGDLTFNNTAASYTISQGTGGTLHIGGAATVSNAGGSHSITAPVSLDSTTTVDVTRAVDTLTITGAVGGAGGMAVGGLGGVGTVLLTNSANTYAGPTSISSGTLQIGNGTTGSLGSSTATINNNGALVLDVAGNINLAGGVSGSGNLTQSGSGTLTLAANSTAGAVNVNAGGIQLVGATMTASGALTLASASKFDVNGNAASFGALVGSGTLDNTNPGTTATVTFGTNAAATAFSGIIQNTGASSTLALIKQGAGLTTLSGVNTYSGGTTIATGGLLVNTSGGLGSGAVTVNSADGLQLGTGVTLSNAITDGANANEFADVAADGSATLSGAITIPNGQNFRVGTTNTTSTLTLTGATTGGGTATAYVITRGNIVVAGNGSIVSPGTAATSNMAIGRSSSTSTLNLTLNDNAQLTSLAGMSLGSGTAASDDTTINVTLLGHSSMSAGGTFNLNNDTNASAGALSITLGGTSNLTANAFTVSSTVSSTSTAVVISGGTITAGASDALSPTAPTGNIFMPEFGNANNLTAPIILAVSSGGATINNGGFNISLGQPFIDNGGGTADTMTFSGTGTTVIANANSYGGNTTITAGTVVLANAGGSATGAGTVNVTGGTLASASASRITLLQGSAVATLDNVGAGSISGAVSVGAAGTIAPGEVGSIGTLSLSGLTTVSGATLNFDLGAASASTPTSATGDLLILSSDSIGSGTALTFAGNLVVGDIYRLIGGAAVSGINLANFSIPAGDVLSKIIDPGFIDITINNIGPANLTWNNAAANGLWDNATSANWNSGASNSQFHAADNVTFNDNNPGPGGTPANYAVTLNSTVNPGSITVNNSNGNYSISGTGSIAGTASLTKSGSGTLTLATPNTFSGGVNVSAGTLLIARTNATSTALPKGALNISATGIVQLATNVTLGSQTANPPVNGPASNVHLTSLTISGTGQLDITNNHIIIDYPTGNDPIASISAMIISGFNGGSWTGSGIVSSIALANSLSYGIGYADAADPGNPAGLATGQIEIAYTLLGDANLDGKVNGTDFAILATNFNQAVGGWDQGDFNYDKKANGSDFAFIGTNFNQGASQAADESALTSFAAANGLLSNVPEPASTGLLALGAVSMLSRRRRKNKA